VRIVGDGVHDTFVSGVMELKYLLERTTVRLVVKLPENERDMNYQRVLFSSAVDASKFLKGIGGSNYIVKTLMNEFIRAIDFEPRFPLEKV
jgi:hypothetical protein